MSCYDLFLFAKKICCKCFHDNQRPKSQDNEQPMIQLTEYHQKESQSKIVVQEQSKKMQQANQKNLTFKEREIKPQNAMRTAVCEDQFQSIDSSFHVETQKSLPSAKMIGTLDKIPRSNKEIKTREKKKSQKYLSSQWQDTPIVQNLNVQNQIQQVKDWFKKQYGRARLASFRVNHAVRLRMQGHGMLTLLAHKLEDFKIKFNGENSPNYPKLSNKAKTLSFQYLINQTGESNYKNNKLQKYYEIITNAPTLQQIIRSLVSKEAMKIIHEFKYTQPVEYEGGNLRIPFPILQVRLNGSMSKEQKVFHVASQMGQSSQSKQQQRQIIFVSYSLDQCEQSWQCVIKVFFGLISRVQIYSQSYSDRSEQYFKSKFNQLQLYLQRLHIISS